MNIIACLSLCLLAILPTAAAGGEVSDASRDASPPVANAWADITRVTLEEEGAALTLGLDVAALPSLQPGMAYVVTFSSGGREWYGVLAAAPSPRYFHGPWADGEPTDQAETTGSYSPGVPGRVAITFPRASLPSDVLAVDGLGALALDIRPQLARASPLVLDAAEGAVVVPLAPGDAAVEPAAAGAGEGTASVRAATPGFGLLLVASGALVAAALRRRKER